MDKYKITGNILRDFYTEPKKLAEVFGLDDQTVAV